MDACQGMHIMTLGQHASPLGSRVLHTISFDGLLTELLGEII